MLLVVIIFVLLSAFLNALAAVLQRRATGQIDAAQLFRRRVLGRALQSNLWRFGVGLQILAFFAQGVALNRGSLVLVEPLLTTDLLFLMALLHFGLHSRMGRREWLAALLLSGGLSGLLAVANPRGATTVVTLGSWLLTLGVAGSFVVVGAIASRSVADVRLRGLVAGLAAGIHFALTAAATKLVLNQLQYGVWHEFASWQLYMLIIIGVSSALSTQSAYGSGPLAITQPTLEITESLIGSVIGLTLFSEAIDHAAGDIALELGCALLIVLGIILLAGSSRLERPALVKGQ